MPNHGHSKVKQFKRCHDIVVILGPTASGKSALGIKLAKKFHGIIISADSRQVYRGMNIGTGKVTKKEMSGVPHYLLDVASPKSQYSVARYVKTVHNILRRSPAHQPVFLVGGTPFYIDALTAPSSFSPVPPNPTLRRRLAAMSLTQLNALLKKIAIGRWKTIDRANRRRIERAIEIASAKTPPGGVRMPDIRVLKIGLTLPRHVLFARIDRRVDARMKQGMLAEVAKLHRQGVSWKRLDDFGLEYRFLSRHLRGKLSKAEAVTQLKTAIHHFAKRQMTWWKRDQDICWIKPTNTAGAERLIRYWLQS